MTHHPRKDEEVSHVDPTVEHEESKVDGHEMTVFEELDPAEESRVVRKIDMVVMPLMAFVYFFQYLDKGSINYAAVFGLREDLDLTGEEFSWVVSLFYFGQLVSEYPAAYLLSRLPITPFVGSTIIAWGVVEMCLGACKDFNGIAATRFFLGLSEGCVSPAFVIITSNWYRRREHPMRVATWVSMNGISQIGGALIMYLVGRADLNIESWRAMFLISGGATVACGIAFLLMMPHNTTTAWFLNEHEREVATRRLAMDRATRDRSSYDKAQAYEALRSPYSLALCSYGSGDHSSHSNPKVISGFGFSNFRTMLVGLPSGAIVFVAVWVSALIPRFFPGTRLYTALFLACVPLVGSAMVLCLPEEGYEWGIVAGTWLAGTGSALIASAAGLMASNVKGNTKKSIVSTSFFISYCVGCIVGPQAWTEDDAPRYRKGCILSIASWALFIVVILAYMALVRRANQRRDDKSAAGDERYVTGRSATGGQQMGISVDSDLTEMQDKGFRYTT